MCPERGSICKIIDISKYSKLQNKTDLGSAYVSFYHPAAPCWGDFKISDFKIHDPVFGKIEIY